MANIDPKSTRKTSATSHPATAAKPTEHAVSATADTLVEPKKKTAPAAKKSKQTTTSTAKKSTSKSRSKKTTTKTPTKSTASRKQATKNTPAKKAAPATPKTAAKAAVPTEEPKDTRLKVLYCSPEVRPFSGTGGLSEVAGSLPKALNRLGNIDCRVISPLYGSIRKEYRDQMEFLGWTMIPVAWRTKYMGVFKMELDGVIFYFIDNEEYFAREGLYGYYDDCERFTFFSRAIFESLAFTGFKPDIMHANDWQTALVPIYQDAIYHRAFMTTIFTIHNIEYQGSFGKEVIADLLGLPEGAAHLVEFGDSVNLLKGGMTTANMVSTVSASYAQELRSPMAAFGLDGVVRACDNKFRGILNGIDTEVYNPETDPILTTNFSAKAPGGKAACRSHLQELAGLPVREVPVVSLISRLVPAKGVDLLRETLDRLLGEEDFQLVLLGTGFEEYENWFRDLEGRWPDKVKSWITFNVARSHEIYAGSDIFLMPSRSEPCGLSQMIAMRYGTVPVVRATGGLRDSVKDCSLEDGTGFVFEDYSPQALYDAVKRALGMYRNSTGQQALAVRDMEQDFSWGSSAQEYRKMYEQVRYH